MSQAGTTVRHRTTGGRHLSMTRRQTALSSEPKNSLLYGQETLDENASPTELR
jgi:hypothetical protein